MSLFNFKRFIACFVDSNGDYVGKTIFRRSVFGNRGFTKKTFTYDGGTYNINPLESSRLELSLFFSFFFDNYIYVYQIDNPDPISFKDGGFKPIMSPEAYKARLESKLIKDLHNIGRWDINWRLFIIVAAVILLLYYLMNYTNLFHGSSDIQNARAILPILIKSNGRLNNEEI